MTKKPELRRIRVFCILLGCLLLQGCSKPMESVELFNMAVEVQEQAERGEWYVVDEVRHGDVFKAAASFIWPEPGSAGKHSFRWEVYQEGKLIRREQDSTYNFTSSPFKVQLNIDSSALKLGECELVLYLDGNEYGRMTTTIVKSNRTQ